MKRFFKRLFCKHEWQLIEETYNKVIFECKKCGQKTTYWDSY